MKFSQKNSKNVQINGNVYLLHDFALEKASIFSFLLDPSISQETIDIKIPSASESVLEKILETMYLKCDYGKSIIADEKITLEYMISILAPMMHMSLEKSIIDDCIMKTLEIIKTDMMNNAKKKKMNDSSEDSENYNEIFILQKQHKLSILIDLIKMKICPNLLLIISDHISFSFPTNIDIVKIKKVNTELKLAEYTESSKSYIIMKMFKTQKKYEQIVTDSINFFTTEGKSMSNLSDDDIDTIVAYIINKMKEKDDSEMDYKKFVKMTIPKLKVENPNARNVDLMGMVGPLWMQYKKDNGIVNDKKF